MSKVYTGIQIGNYSVKLTQVTDDKIDKISVTPLPENLLRTDVFYLLTQYPSL